MQKSRFVFFDLLKIILAFLVVNLHYEAIILTKSFSAFFFLGWYAVPLFIVISFYFNSKYFLNRKLSAPTLLKKIKRLSVPLLFWSGLGFLIEPALVSLKHLVRQILFGTVVDVPLYYLNMMIVFTFFCFFLGKWLRKHYQLFLIITLLISLSIEITGLNSIIVSFFPYNLQFFVIRFIEFYKYVALGSLLPFISSFIKKTPFINWITLGLFLLFTVIDTSRQWVKQSDVIIYSGLLQFLGVGFLVLFLSLNQKIKIAGPINKTIQIIGRYTMGIYSIHFFFVQNLRMLLQNYSVDYQATHYVIVVSVFASCFSLSLIIDKLSRGSLSGAVS